MKKTFLNKKIKYLILKENAFVWFLKQVTQEALQIKQKCSLLKFYIWSIFLITK